jgi:hypothetical protein
MPLPGLCATKGKVILITRPEKRTEHEELTIGRMKRCDHTIGKCCRLFEEFAELFRSRDEHTYAAKNVKAWALVQQWIEDAKKFEIPELKAFAVKLFQDVEAMVAAIVIPYSQGQTEGRVNKLKLIKRSMYKRGRFDLWRQRVIYASAASMLISLLGESPNSIHQILGRTTEAG